VIEILESYPSVEDKVLLERLYETLKKGQVLRSGNYFWFGDNFHHIQCQIIDVDIKRKWTLTNYDGAEGVEYLDYKCIDDKINYWKK
jgi:hypothetical protein